MLEREQDWKDFLFCISKPENPVELISRHFNVPMQHVLMYKDMLAGPPILLQHGDLPEALKPKAIAFKYRAVIRWIETDPIKQAWLDYDAGIIELATGKAIVRGEAARVLYRYERVKPAAPRQYFFAPVLP